MWMGACACVCVCMCMCVCCVCMFMCVCVCVCLHVCVCVCADVCELVSLIGFNTLPGQPSQPTLTSLGQGYVCLSVTFWQSDRGLLHAIAAT